MIVEREVQLSELHHLDIASVFTSRGLEPLLTDFSNLVPHELLVREFYSNFYDINEAFRSFSVFVSGQCLQVSPDIIAQVYNVNRVSLPIYPYEESRTEPPSFEVMMLRLFQRPYPYMGGTFILRNLLRKITL